MTPEQYREAGRIFRAALELEPDRRPAFLAEACGADRETYDEVKSLLESHLETETFIANSAVEVVATELASGGTSRAIRLSRGTMLGPYRIQEPLGAGGMGEVYRAEDTRLHRSVAIKVLPDQFATDSDARARFEQEARAAAALNHPHICTLHDIGHHEGIDFLVMEYLEGETMEARLARGPLSLEEAIDYTIQAAEALDKAHRQGVLHRDLKPANIMLTSEGIKLLDFGLAKLRTSIDAESPSSRHTQPGIVMGTVRYMSPEQARGLKDIDQRTDLFSLGVVLYEMVAGKKPFGGATTSDVLVEVLNKDPAPLLRNGAPVSEELQRIASKALKKNRYERYASAGEMLGDLRAADRGQPPPGKVSFGSRALAKAVLVVVGVLVAAGGIWYLGFAHSAIEAVAVMPFDNVGNNPDAEYLADGITDSVISSLSKFSTLRVMSHSSVYRYKGRHVDPQTFGNELKVQAVLTGRIVPRGDRLEISVELVDVRDNHQLWGEQYAQPLADLLNVQAEIARKTSEGLRLRLSGADEASLSKAPTNSVEAYQAYLKGNFYFAQQTTEGFTKSIEYFEEATTLDQKYALAYVGLANSYIFLGADGDIAPNEVMPKAKANVMKALKLDSSLPEAHAALGIVKLVYDWDWPGAEKELSHNLPLSPQSIDAFSCALHFADPLGGNGSAIKQIKHALDLDPVSLPPNLEFGCASYYGRQYDQAVRQFKETLVLYPNVPLVYYGLGRTYGQRHMYPEAIAELNKGKALSGDWPPMIAELAWTHAVSGNTREGRLLLEQLKQLATRRYVDPYLLATAYMGFGEKDKVFEWLDKAYADRSSSMPWLKIEPKWDPLHSDSRFTALLDRVGFER